MMRSTIFRVWALIAITFITMAANRFLLVDENAGVARMDDFGRLVVANPFAEADHTFKYDLLSDQFDYSVTGTAVVTHVFDESSAQLTVSASGDEAILQSDVFYRYQAGRAGDAMFSLVPGAPTTGVTKRWGYFSADDGLFFQLEGDGTFKVCRRTSTSGTSVDVCTSAFNTNDPESWALLDVLDFSKGNIFGITFQWLGTGVARMRIENNAGASKIIHEFLNPNVYDVPYMRTGSLPLRFEQVAASGATTTTMKVICTSFASSGGQNPAFFERSFPRPSLGTTTDVHETHVISFRLKELFKGEENRIAVVVSNINYALAKAPGVFRAYLNPTLSGDTWVDTGSDSALEYCTADVSFAGGAIVDSRAVLALTGQGSNPGSQASGEVELKNMVLSRDAFNDGSDTLTITVQRYGSTDADFSASIGWAEVR